MPKRYPQYFKEIRQLCFDNSTCAVADHQSVCKRVLPPAIYFSQDWDDISCIQMAPYVGSKLLPLNTTPYSWNLSTKSTLTPFMHSMLLLSAGLLIFFQGYLGLLHRLRGLPSVTCTNTNLKTIVQNYTIGQQHAYCCHFTTVQQCFELNAHYEKLPKPAIYCGKL